MTERGQWPRPIRPETACDLQVRHTHIKNLDHPLGSPIDDRHFFLFTNLLRQLRFGGLELAPSLVQVGEPYFLFMGQQACALPDLSHVVCLYCW